MTGKSGHNFLMHNEMKHVFLIFVSLYLGLAFSAESSNLNEDLLKIIQKNGLSKDHFGAEIQS
ncbi:MAG TPA: hypothetical protein PLB70_03105, partial [Paludibacteraceae bacterium]|nr:hypothetical protein [Paludibacteraceae bacterium]